MDDVLVGQQDVSGTDGLVTAFVQVSDAAESPAASGSCICNLYHVADAREPNGSRVLPVQSCSLLFPQSSLILRLPSPPEVVHDVLSSPPGIQKGVCQRLPCTRWCVVGVFLNGSGIRKSQGSVLLEVSRREAETVVCTDVHKRTGIERRERNSFSLSATSIFSSLSSTSTFISSRCSFSCHSPLCPAPVRPGCLFCLFLSLLSPSSQPPIDRVSPNVALKLVTKPILLNRLSGVSD